jgi:DNA polymerase/3'-5' exonuclease PolX
VFVLQPIHRRIDIRYFPANCYWCGVLYFTGDSLLNQEMRRIAIEKDLKLSEYCLATREGTGPALLVACEKDVFDHLGMKFLEPSERNMS